MMFFVSTIKIRDGSTIYPNNNKYRQVAVFIQLQVGILGTKISGVLQFSGLSPLRLKHIMWVPLYEDTESQF